MKQWRWIISTVLLAAVLALIVFRPLPFLFYPKLPHVPFFGRALYILILTSVLCLYRVARGPTGADRLVAVDLLGVMVTGFCAVLTITTQRTWYLDVGIAWALQSFITVLALSKYLENRNFDD
jgi:multicomponent Na+:H+ antiporter subunit F